jgi:hypothetical protein
VPRQPPQASVAQRRPHLTVNQESHTEVRVLPGAPYVLVAQWIARVVPNHEVGRSNRPEDTMRDSPGERRSAKPPDGFDPRRVSRLVQVIRAAVS